MNIFSKISNLKKKPCISVLVLLLIIGFVLSFASFGVEAARVSDRNSNKKEFNIEVSSSLSSNGKYYTMNMDVENPGSDFTGYLRLRAELNGYSVGYDVDISIPKGSTKTYTVNVPVSAAVNQDVVQINIYDKNDKSVYAEKFRSVFSSQRNVINTGILSDKPDAISFLDNGGKKIDYNGDKYAVKIDSLDPADISTEIDSLKLLVVNDYDTSTLSTENIGSIVKWVRSGGILVLGTGENAERVLSGFDDYDSSFVGLNYLGPIEYQLTMDDDADTYQAAMFDDNYEYNYLTAESNMKYVGSGGIIVFTADLTVFSLDEDIRDEEVENLYRNAMDNSSNSSNSGNYYHNLNSYDVESVQAYMEKPARTGAGLLAFLIIIYVALVGPVIYLILKAINKREKIWIAIPALSVLFVLFVFLISIGVRVRGVTMNSVTAIEVNGDMKETYVFGYAPDPEKWSVDTKETYVFGDIVSDYSYKNENSVNAAIKQKSDKDQLTFYPDNAFDTGCFVLNSNSDFSGDFEFDLEDDSYDPSGTVTGIQDGLVKNNTGVDFDYVMMISQAGMQVEEDVQNGDTIMVDISGSGYSSYYSASEILRNTAKQPYDHKEYDKAGAIAAMALVAENQELNNQTFTIIGVRKGKSVTQENEKSWECYYKVY